MRLSIRRPVISKLIGVAAVLTVCYFVFHLRRPDWESRISSATAPPSQHKADAILEPPIPEPPIPESPIPESPIPESPIPEPPIPEPTIPELLWCKLGPKGLNDELRGYTTSCITKNPTFKPEFLTERSGDDCVKDYLTSRPDIVDNFLNISIPIIKADLLRYLVLYEHGGVWNDLDVSCEAPVSEWVPEQYQANASVFVGLEFDVDVWVRQFASWTIMAKPKSPHLLTVVEDCLEYLREKTKEHNVGIQDLRLDMIDDIVDVSGPRRLTRGILKSLSKMMDKGIGNEEIAHVSEPRLIGDVLVLPDYSFANSMNEQYGDKKTGHILVTHHYAGSWKNPKGARSR